ncbi:MAG: YitT family protein [Candidatus Izemoplasmatales bacterium]
MRYKFTPKKNAIFFLGLTLLGVCVTLIQQTNLGMSAWDAFNRNLYEGIPLEYKYLNPIVALVLISIAYLLQKKKPSVWMLFPLVISFYVGLVIDLLLLIIPSVVTLSIGWNLAYLFAAIIICAIGLNLILYCEYPLPALDELCNGIAKKLHITFGKGKLIGELIAIVLTVIVGLLFSFQDEYFFIGPTTIVFGLLIGFVVDFFKKPVQSLLVRIDK